MNTITEVDETTPRRARESSNDSSQEAETVVTYENELKVIIRRAAGFCMFFILLQVTLLTASDFDYSLIPLFLVDFKVIFSTFYYKGSKSACDLFFSKELNHQVLSLTFKSMILIHHKFKSFNSLFLVIPLFLAFLNQFLSKSSKTEECKYLVWLVSFKQIVTISELLFMLTVLNFCLQIENYVVFEPSGVLWPVYIGLCFCGVTVIGLILFVLGSFLSWASEEISTSEFLISFWLLFSALGATLTLLTLVLRVSSSSSQGPESKDKTKSEPFSQLFCLAPIAYLSIFTIITQVFLQRISNWWKFFFTDSDSESMDLPLPSQGATRRVRFHSRISKTIKKAPRVLMRISSSYFKPAETPKAKYVKRTLSLKTNMDETVEQHKRHSSNPPKLEVFSPTAKDAIDKICEMCCERLCNAVVMECGHGGICYECSLEVWKTVGHCHLCRGEITQVLQIEKHGGRLFRVNTSTRAVYSDQDVE